MGHGYKWQSAKGSFSVCVMLRVRYWSRLTPPGPAPMIGRHLARLSPQPSTSTVIAYGGQIKGWDLMNKLHACIKQRPAVRGKWTAPAFVHSSSGPQSEGGTRCMHVGVSMPCQGVSVCDCTSGCLRAASGRLASQLHCWLCALWRTLKGVCGVILQAMRELLVVTVQRKNIHPEMLLLTRLVGELEPIPADWVRQTYTNQSHGT